MPRDELRVPLRRSFFFNLAAFSTSLSATAAASAGGAGFLRVAGTAAASGKEIGGRGGGTGRLVWTAACPRHSSAVGMNLTVPGEPERALLHSIQWCMCRTAGGTTLPFLSLGRVMSTVKPSSSSPSPSPPSSFPAVDGFRRTNWIEFIAFTVL